MNKLKIVMLAVKDLTPYENNTRKHAQKDIDQIKEAIKADGFNDPIGVWGEKNIIVEGHGRVLACKQLGIKTVPCIRLDELTDEQRKEYAIRHNRSAEFSTWDFDILAKEVADLESLGFDMSGLDFKLDSEYMEPVTYDGSGSIEYGEDEYSDDKFECECPNCGFRFNE